MEMVLNNGFCEMKTYEMDSLNGGASVGEAIAGTVGIAAILWAAPVAIVVGSAGLGIGMAVAGTGAVINLFSSDK